jgi:hypothetical protein
MDIEILTEPIISKIVEIYGTKLQVFTDGRVYRFKKNGDLKLIGNNPSNHGGYNQIGCNNNKIVSRHRIIAYTFLNLDINNTTKQVDHIDGVRLNNCLTNLRIVTNQQNHWNRTTAKGYSWNKRDKKWRSYIGVNGKLKNLGVFDTEKEARDAYLKAKEIYHIIQ